MWILIWQYGSWAMRKGKISAMNWSHHPDMGFLKIDGGE
jgi:hypothetical protein